ncbi:MAG: formate dehydrogenase accessory sulfurtransferase FdhD [Saprospiraceae bacterium]|nr:formate dehydrogenase accessory sulfurtransferase FdhD [Saprospiraceae bacterium]
MSHFAEQRRILQRRHARSVEIDDHVVLEEPLEIKLEYGPAARRERYTLAVTMRTPGHDEDLIRGFLFTEGIIDRPEQVAGFERPESSEDHTVTALLDPDLVFLPDRQQRHFYTSSSCGVCGKASIDMVHQVSAYRLDPAVPVISEKVLMQMSDRMRQAQHAFDLTGGIHAAALFDLNGQVACTREDVGRHNAVDKLIGWAGQQSLLPLSNSVVMVSGRAGFELIQKAVVAGVPLFVAVGAPSSLAIELAERSDMTLVAFMRDHGFNVYTHPQRIRLDQDS